MLTGARLFQGETISDTLAAVLRQDIPWSALPPGTPAEITRLLRRCLERDRKNRLHDIADARIVLEEVMRGGGSDEPVAAASATVLEHIARSHLRRRRHSRARVGCRARQVDGADTSSYTSGSDCSTGRAKTERRDAGWRTGRLAGRQFCRLRRSLRYKGRRSCISSDSTRLRRERSSGQKERPSPFSPLMDAGLRTVVSIVSRGSPSTAASRFRSRRCPTSGPGGVWLPDNTIVFAKSWLSELWSVSSDGWRNRARSAPSMRARGEIGHWFPSALPDPRRVLITTWMKGAGVNDAEIAVLDLDTGHARRSVQGRGGTVRRAGIHRLFQGRRLPRRPIRRRRRSKPRANRCACSTMRTGTRLRGTSAHTDINAAGTLAYLERAEHLSASSSGSRQGARANRCRIPRAPTTARR